MAKILIVDDDGPIRKSLREIIEFDQFQVEEACDGKEAINKVKNDKFDVVIMDVKMPKMDGIEALERLQIIAPELPVVMLSGHGTIETAVDAVKKGAFDFISKPPDLNRILITIRNAMDKRELVRTAKKLQKSIKPHSKGVNIVGNSAPLLQLKRDMDKVAPTNASVLILGANGTGKELIARYIHEKSRRANGPLIEVNCAAIQDTMMLDTLFGHWKGAFTDAKTDAPGKFELAHEGTLFLDEIGDMSLEAQAAMLKAIEEKKIYRLGNQEKEINIDIRVIAATNKDLRALIAVKKFREDLYHRLAKIVVKMPTLNERKDDIPLLIEHFNRLHAEDSCIEPKHFTPGAIKAMQEYNWTGNIRELSNAVERLLILCDNTIIEEDVYRLVYPNNVALEYSQYP